MAYISRFLNPCIGHALYVGIMFLIPCIGHACPICWHYLIYVLALSYLKSCMDHALHIDNILYKVMCGPCPIYWHYPIYVLALSYLKSCVGHVLYVAIILLRHVWTMLYMLALSYLKACVVMSYMLGSSCVCCHYLI